MNEAHFTSSFRNRTNPEKSMGSSRYVSSFESTSCLFHCNNPISHICVDCEFKCLCGVCLQEGLHKDHEVKNTERGAKVIERLLNQNLIKLDSKADLLAYFNENISNHRVELQNNYQNYIKEIEAAFDQIQRQIATKKQSILKIADRHYNDELSNLTQMMRSVNEEIRNSRKTSEYITKNIQKLESTSLCMFFWEKRQYFHNSVHDSVQQRKQSLKETKWEFDLSVFHGLNKMINDIEVEKRKSIVLLREKGKKRDESLRKDGNLKELEKFLKTPKKMTKSNSKKLISLGCSPHSKKTQLSTNFTLKSPKKSSSNRQSHKYHPEMS